MPSPQQSSSLPGSQPELPLGIGEAARRAGVTPDTLRYYEAAGLLAAPERDAAGPRPYPPSALNVVGVIRALRAAGFSIREIRTVVSAKTRGRPIQVNTRAVEQALVRLRSNVAERRAALNEAAHLLDTWLADIRAAAPDRPDDARARSARGT